MSCRVMSFHFISFHFISFHSFHSFHSLIHSFAIHLWDTKIIGTLTRSKEQFSLPGLDLSHICLSRWSAENLIGIKTQPWLVYRERDENKWNNFRCLLPNLPNTTRVMSSFQQHIKKIPHFPLSLFSLFSAPMPWSKDFFQVDPLLGAGMALPFLAGGMAHGLMPNTAQCYLWVLHESDT